MEHKRYSEEQIAAANAISIAEYAETHGYICEKAGKEIHIKGFGGLYINPQENNFYCHSEAKGGHGCISFLQKIEGMSFKQAMEALVGEGAVSYTKNNWKPAEKNKPSEFTAPPKAEHYKNAYAYLINERKLDVEIINDFVKQGLLYQTTTTHTKDDKTYTNANIVFLHKDDNGTVCGASLQGTNSRIKFKQNLEGTDNDFGFVYNKGKADTVYLFEAPIDMMSFIKLHPEITDGKFVAMEGLKPSIAEHYINSGVTVISCVDNDTAGQGFNDKLLKVKMQESLSVAGGLDLDNRTVCDREPPIEYTIADLNGKQCSFFLSKKDFDDAKKHNADISGSSFVWVNRSNFQINHECLEADVKDFNDLLKKKCCYENIDKATEWAKKVNRACEEQKKERKAEERSERPSGVRE